MFTVPHHQDFHQFLCGIYIFIFKVFLGNVVTEPANFQSLIHPSKHEMQLLLLSAPRTWGREMLAISWTSGERSVQGGAVEFHLVSPVDLGSKKNMRRKCSRGRWFLVLSSFWDISSLFFGRRERLLFIEKDGVTRQKAWVGMSFGRWPIIWNLLCKVFHYQSLLLLLSLLGKFMAVCSSRQNLTSRCAVGGYIFRSNSILVTRKAIFLWAPWWDFGMLQELVVRKWVMMVRNSKMDGLLMPQTMLAKRVGLGLGFWRKRIIIFPAPFF